MPTRCNIIVQSSISGENILYKHCDGYPSGIGEGLQTILEKYSKSAEVYDYKSLTKQILDVYDDIIEDDKTANDISYLYEIIVYEHTIFYTCYEVPVFGAYDIDNIADDKDCNMIECKEYNNYTSNSINENNAEDVIDDARVLLEYTNKRNYFIDQLITKYKKSDEKDISLITELLKLSYDQGYNNNKLDNI